MPSADVPVGDSSRPENEEGEPGAAPTDRGGDHHQDEEEAARQEVLLRTPEGPTRTNWTVCDSSRATRGGSRCSRAVGVVSVLAYCRTPGRQSVNPFIGRPSFPAFPALDIDQSERCAPPVPDAAYFYLSGSAPEDSAYFCIQMINS